MTLALNVKGWNMKQQIKIMPDENEVYIYTPTTNSCGAAGAGYSVGRLSGRHMDYGSVQASTVPISITTERWRALLSPRPMEPNTNYETSSLTENPLIPLSRKAPFAVTYSSLLTVLQPHISLTLQSTTIRSTPDRVAGP